MADRSLVVVNYRSASLCRDAVASARAASSEPLEVIIVDNSCDRAEAEALAGIGAETLIVAAGNLGYAAGANAGIRAASGTKLLVSNPDVVFGAGCVDELVTALGGRVALSGPRFSWDAEGRWLLPPASVMTFRSELSRSLASWSGSRSASRSRALFFERIAFWKAASPTRVAAVSGAVMAIDRDAWKRIGGFDERYRLYYEEIDFMRALGRERYEVRYVPTARCLHLYDQSAASESEQQRKFAESQSLYMAKWHGKWSVVPGLLERGRRRDPPPATTLSPSEALAIPEPVGAYVVEASPLSSFDTAAGHFPRAAEIRLPGEIWARFHGAALYLRVVEAGTGREISRGMLPKSK